MIEVIIGVSLFIAAIVYCICCGAAKTRSPAYRAWLDKEQWATVNGHASECPDFEELGNSGIR